MKNPERVAQLLAELQAECEYRFEFDAVAKLAQSISETPRVTIIDDSHQEFCSKRYHKRNQDGHFFRSGNKALHRDVWELFWGDIPAGYVIHHIDEDKNNNNIENLKLVSRAEHSRLHNSDVCRHPIKRFICKMCGKEYESRDNGKNKFCSKACIQKHYILTHPEKKICPFCGKEFVTRHSKTKYCSSTCASRAYRKCQ